MTPWSQLSPVGQVKAIVSVALGLALLVAMVFGGWKVWDWRKRALASEAEVTTLEGTAGATSATTDALSAGQADAQRVEIVVTQARAQSQRAIEELSHADPTVASWRSTPVPVGLRDVARQRREARERGTADGPEGAGPGRPRTD